MLRFITAGESHGPGIIAILEGMPAGIEVDEKELSLELSRRRKGYGRGGRAKIEDDEVQITSGVIAGKTTGAPIAVFIPNKDYVNWKDKYIPIVAPRPGHADLPGMIKYGFEDCRPVAERASARETAARVACGYFAKKLLYKEGIEVISWVTQIGQISADLPPMDERMYDENVAKKLFLLAESSEVRCPDTLASEQMKKLIDDAREKGDTLGGIFEVAALNVPIGLGSYVHWDRRLDARLAAAVMSIPGVKGVEIGMGFKLAEVSGREALDPILISKRSSNKAGGIEGGMSNGEIIFLRAAMKPIPTLQNPLPSVNIVTKKECRAQTERSDICAVGSAAVVAESMVALVLADALLELRGGDRW
ncbi:MAG: chorismate synthase [Thermovenabulum sp.]|uniref:chorismate synthase n=1 Tax=Thermovenabulum sp. TaxID=3100335 RepID=UPI003C7C5EDE